jgi:uncharacterized membrane protein YdjX (TVP38/TMEM64 family)
MNSRASHRFQPLVWGLLWVRTLWKQHQKEGWLLLASLVVAAFLVWWWNDSLFKLLDRVSDLRTWVLSFGVLAPLVYTAIFMLQIIVAPLPGHFMGVMGGYLFGVLWGSLYSITGMALGASFAIFIGRRFGRPLVERFIAPADLNRWEKRLQARSALTWWLLFLFPIPDLIFYVAGLSHVPLRALLLALLAGRGLGLLLANSMGHWSGFLGAQWALVNWAIIFGLGALLYFNQRRLRLYGLLGVRRLRRYRHSMFD